jgi:N,N-dimethylformamidase
MMPLAGYADRLSVRPGETIKFHVSNATGADVTAKLVRVICADPNPAGPGVQLADIHAPITPLAEPRHELSPQGSYGIVPCNGLAWPDVLTISADIQPTLITPDDRDILVCRGQGPALDFALRISATGTIVASLRLDGIDIVEATSATHLVAGTWYRVWATLDRPSTVVTVNVAILARLGEADDAIDTVSTDAVSSDAVPTGDAPLSGAQTLETIFIGGTLPLPDEDADLTFNGRMQAVELINEGNFADREPALIAAWDFAQDIGTGRIVDTGPNSLHGRLINSPTRAVRGSNWTGREHCFRHAPEQYGAIHFHEDDLDDCLWPATHACEIPASLRSGVYALILKAGTETENIPFFVVPPKGKPTAKIAVLASTFTYTVYGNHARPEWSKDPAWQDAWRHQTSEWPNAYTHNPGDHAEYGLSTYNMHTDGSGISIASWHRPMLNMRVGYITYPYPQIRASGLRHFPADTHLTAWLEAKGYAFDIITDAELHAEGYELLRDYAVVMTGTHPEYHTAEMLDALERYRDTGGRLMYLGGNGFYWKIALSTEKTGVIEIRRAEGGIRAWAAEPGEYYNQFDGEYGGLWRRNGRAPQQLVGVGFTAQGNFVGSHYRIAQNARSNPKVNWIFDGIDGDVIGGFGLSGHGAAGFELDRTDVRLGTPTNAIVIAASEDHPPEAPWVLVPEEQLTHITTVAGQTHKQLIRADMTYFDVPGGGAVFSVGSITFCGSLPTNNYNNNVSKLLGNVLDRFQVSSS